MAESVLFDVAARIIESSGSLALKEFGLLWGVKDELDKLKDTVFFFSKSNQLVYDLKVGHKIKEIRQKLDAIKKDRKFLLKECPEEIGVTARKRDDTHSFVLEAEVIGREDAKKEIIDKIIFDSNVKENVAILPICGIGGLGKTTLAQFIFNDEKVDKHFELKMWVCVSNNFDVRKVVEKILESATKLKPGSVEMDTLVHDLLKEIGGKKYILVLDDVWNEEVAKWDELKKLLMCGASGSRILVTTRSAIVARITHTNIEPYSLQALDSQKSWSLFKQVAFEKGLEPENSRIVTIGKEIVEKCSGVPLAIKTIGRLLSFENSEAGWVSFKDNKLPKIKKNDIIPTLKLSYDQLPSHLKQCFAYCSIFPKDYEINKLKLIDLWIAQGFIKLSNQNERLEDVGHEYFMDLFWRSFFQEAKMDDLGNVTRIKMHDLMHDLAISVAGSLITLLESEGKIVGQKTRHILFVHNLDFSCMVSSFSPKANRIRTLLCPDHKFLGLAESSTSCEAIFSNLKFLRVLDLHGGKFDLVPSSICKLKHLRYIDLSGNANIQKLPNSISMLQNLYSIRLSYCEHLKALPRGITKLVNLRHLYNDGCKELTCMPRGLGQLTNLQTLSTFVVHDSNSSSMDGGLLSELNRLNNLSGRLEIRGLRYGEDYDGANLKEKEHLQDLELIWSQSTENIDDEMVLEGFEPHPNLKRLYIYHCGDVRFSMWLLSLTNLVYLGLFYCMKLKYLPPLSRLPSLKFICLKGLEEIEYVSDCGDNNEFSSSSSSSAFFPSLEEIRISNCRNLKGCWRSSDSDVDFNTTDYENSIEKPMRRTGHALLIPSFPPRLSSLKLSNCPMLTSFPMFPHLNEELCLWYVSWKPVQQTMMNNAKLPTTMEASSSSTPNIACSSAPLSKLKNMIFSIIEDVETLPEDGLQNLISLQRLEIRHCPRLKSLSQGVQHLAALQKLILINCPVLDLGNDEHGMQWKRLKSLVSLLFHNIPKLVSLPLGLQHVTTLRELQISDCSSLMAIPEWICNWASLERFTITSCSGLTSLPEAMSRLTTLRTLVIYDCPILLRRCEEDRGEDWTKIAHIPELDVD